ncbi:unnamed protein product, partial [Discosporangium mesarthrocarpum]
MDADENVTLHNLFYFYHPGLPANGLHLSGILRALGEDKLVLPEPPPSERSSTGDVEGQAPPHHHRLRCRSHLLGLPLAERHAVLTVFCRLGHWLPRRALVDLLYRLIQGRGLDDKLGTCACILGQGPQGMGGGHPHQQGGSRGGVEGLAGRTAARPPSCEEEGNANAPILCSSCRDRRRWLDPFSLRLMSVTCRQLLWKTPGLSEDTTKAMEDDSLQEPINQCLLSLSQDSPSRPRGRREGLSPGQGTLCPTIAAPMANKRAPRLPRGWQSEGVSAIVSRMMAKNGKHTSMGAESGPLGATALSSVRQSAPGQSTPGGFDPDLLTNSRRRPQVKGLDGGCPDPFPPRPSKVGRLVYEGEGSQGEYADVVTCDQGPSPPHPPDHTGARDTEKNVSSPSRRRMASHRSTPEPEATPKPGSKVARIATGVGAKSTGESIGKAPLVSGSSGAQRRPPEAHPGGSGVPPGGSGALPVGVRERLEPCAEKVSVASRRGATSRDVQAAALAVVSLLETAASSSPNTNTKTNPNPNPDPIPNSDLAGQSGVA